MAKTGRPKSKAINPFILSLMERDGYKSINEAAKGWGIPQGTLDRWADMSSTSNKYFKCILDSSEKIGVAPEVLMRGILEQRKSI